MKKTVTLSTLVLGAVAVAVLMLSPAASQAGPDGKTLFVDTHKCNLCHSAKSAEIEAKAKSDKMKGPDLSGYEPPEGFDVMAFLKQQRESSAGEKHKKGFKGSDEELATILDWLGSLEPQEAPARR